jgi:hypothetical protein
MENRLAVAISAPPSSVFVLVFYDIVLHVREPYLRIDTQLWLMTMAVENVLVGHWCCYQWHRNVSTEYQLDH